MEYLGGTVSARKKDERRERRMPSRLERRMIRIDLDETIVTKAEKWAFEIRREAESRLSATVKDQKKVKPKPPSFRETLNMASATYSEFVDCCLIAAGFFEHTKSKVERIRPISIDTAEVLKDMAAKRGVDMECLDSGGPPACCKWRQGSQRRDGRGNSSDRRPHCADGAKEIKLLRQGQAGIWRAVRSTIPQVADLLIG